jgi:hypothetical protein
MTLKSKSYFHLPIKSGQKSVTDLAQLISHVRDREYMSGIERDQIRVKGKGNRSGTTGVRGDLILTIVIDEEKEEYTKVQALKQPLRELEIRALNRVGLNPQNLPKGMDDYIRLYLLEKAEVDVTPVSSSGMVGGGTAAFAAGFTSGLVREGGASVGTALTTGNIKHQTSVQEWIHWKKYALEQTDFEQYRKEGMEKYEKMHEVMVKYIRSDKGKECCDYEHWRPLARVAIVVIGGFGSIFGWIAALVVNSFLLANKGVSFPEWVIQKVFGKRSFASIRPLGGVNAEGVLELEY